MAEFKKDISEQLKHVESFRLESPKSQYETARLKGDKTTIILYTTGRYQIQGSLEKAKVAVAHLKKAKHDFTIVGSDEVLKGDSFGGIVVAAVRANPKERDELEGFVPGDSKKLSDNKIIDIAMKIMEKYKYSVQEIYPKDYNKLVENKGLTHVLNELHEKCNNELKTNDSKHIVDKFPGCKAGDIMEERADENYIEVMAASLIARYVGLLQISTLSKMAGFKLPLGSTHVEEALKEMKKRKLDLSEFAKTGFNNVKKFV